MPWLCRRPRIMPGRHHSLGQAVPTETSMEQTRVDFLRETLKNHPDDTFARYALAMELTQSSQLAAAWEHFEYLLTRHPEYLATYYQAGMLLWKQGHRAEAQDVFEQGVEVTRRQGNHHAQSELEKALEELASDK